MPGLAPLDHLSIVLPCFDEAPNVAAAVLDAQVAASRVARTHEVIVVDDGSRDGTGEIAAALAALDERVRVVTHERNRGYGAAVRSGLHASRGDWILLTDGDRQFDLGELDLLVAHAPDHELVAGFRIDRADPLHRRVAAGAWNRAMRASFGIPVRDVDCAFKLLRGDAARALPLQSDGAMVSTELVVRAQMARWSIAEVGVHHRPRMAGSPTGGDPRVVLRALREQRRFRRRLRAEAQAAPPLAIPGTSASAT